MSTARVRFGETVRLTYQMDDGAASSTKVVKAVLRNASGTAITGSPFTLTHVGTGLFSNSAVSMPATLLLTATYQVFESDATTLDTAKPHRLDVFYLEHDRTEFMHPGDPKALEIIRGEDLVQTLSITENDDTTLVDLSGVTEIEINFVKSDGTNLTKALSTGDIVVLNQNTDLGKIQLVLTDTDTGSLLIGERQTFDVIVDIGTTRKITQYRNVLTVREET